MYYPSRKTKGADQRNRESDLRLCFRICKYRVVFSRTIDTTSQRNFSQQADHMPIM